MKCPHCNYEKIQKHYDDAPIHQVPTGFYKLPIHLERTESAYYDSLQRIALYACPSCMKTFVDT